MLDIQSLDNTLIKQIVKLVNSSSYRKSEKKCVIYGLHLIEEAYKYCFLESVLVAEDHHYENLPKDVPINKVSTKVLPKINLLEGKYDIVGIANFKAVHNDTYNEDCIILDNVQDPGNLGTIIRSAKASGINNILLTNGCVDSYNPKVLRSSQGAVFGVNIIDLDDITNFIKMFKGNIIATVPDAKNSLYDIDLRSTTAFVFGNEGSGISSNILNMIDTKVNIPMQNNTESINVAMAMAVCVFEQLRQRLNK
jgi:TrmH family RNA methyltransferase